jgi:glyoxylase-like metal-dependent hydrolase (beta-lactamase superfamily II)
MPEVHVLSDGYVRETETESRVGSTVSFVRDGDALIVIDPGLVPARSAILDPLTALGVSPEDITDVVISHHHPDHTLNVALFPRVRLHDHWATYEGDLWIDRPAEGFQVSANVSLIETPGHTPQDITTLVSMKDGPVAFTHLWWSEDGPLDDPFSIDPEQLKEGRERVLGLASKIVPGHGPAFTPSDDTPR